MIIYCYVLLAVYFISLGVAIGAKEEIGVTAASVGLVLPVICRVLGWF